MQREIKFRAWDKKEKRMVVHGEFDSMFYFAESATPDPYHVLMQYTGLKDRNGVEIYEGDIFRVPNDVYRMGREYGWKGKEDGIELVYWDEECAAFLSKDLFYLKQGIPIEQINGRYIWVLNMPAESEVIGNIYENPELLNDIT